MAAPAAQVELAYASALQELPNFLPTHGMEPVGIADLRDVIAQRYTARGLPTTAEQIMVTSGAQHALRLLLSVLTSPGERVLVDHPTYPNALEAIRRNGARPVPVPVRPEFAAAGAWDLDGIRSAARQTAARMAYLIPDFHNPTGLCMDSSGRAELAKIAHETRMTLVVDETMVDLWLDAPPPAPVASHGRGAAKTEVVTLGSTAKSLWGGLRVGWIRADAALITQLVGARAAVDLGTPVMDQLAAATCSPTTARCSNSVAKFCENSVRYSSVRWPSICRTGVPPSVPAECRSGCECPRPSRRRWRRWHPTSAYSLPPAPVSA